MPEGPVGDRRQRQLDSIPKMMRVQLPKMGLNFRVTGARQPQDRERPPNLYCASPSDAGVRDRLLVDMHKKYLSSM